jgi:DNA/RNA endonuclease G (NUC1)
VIYRVGDGTGALASTGNPVFLDEYTPSGQFVQSVPVPTITSGSNHRLIASGTATSEGLMTRSTDRRYLVFGGYDAAIPTTSLASTASATTPRVVGRVDVSGNIDTTTALTDWSTGNNPRGVATTNGTDLWVGGAGGGVRYATFGSSTSTQLSSTVTNIRAVEIFAGQLYNSDSSGSTIRLGQVGTGLPTTSPQTITNLPGFATSTGSPYAFFFADLDGIPGVDTLYVADDTTTAGGPGGITKYSLVSGTWSSNGVVGAVADSYRGLTGSVSGTTVTLFAIRKGGTGATGGGELVTFTDSSGYRGAVSGAPTLLATAGANTAFRGVAFAPEGAVVAPSITTQPANVTINTGSSTTLSVIAGGTAPLSYQWYIGSSGDTTNPINGATTAGFTTPALTTSTSYWVLVSNSAGSVNSNTATVTVVIPPPPPTISTNPASQTITSGQTATLTVVASGIPPLSYQWYQGTASDTTHPVTGANSASFTTPSLTATTSYWVRVSNSGVSADSATAVIMVTAASTPLTATGSANLSVVPAGGTTQLTVNVTPGTNPDSTNITVTGDLSSIGGNIAQAFSGSGNTFSFSAMVDAATMAGSKTLPITVSDGQGRSTGVNISLTVTEPLAVSPIVISQIYGGGGNSGAFYTNDFVQLFNRGNTTVDTGGWSLQYAPATGTGDWTGRMPLGGQIAPGQYYLIALASGGAIGAPLPAANVTGSINISQTAGKLALVDNGDLLTGTAGCPDATHSTHVKDLVGYGSTADCYEGTAAVAFSGNLAAQSLFRMGGGSIDTNDNKADFFAQAPPNAFTTAPIVQLPPQVFATYPTTNGLDTPLDATIEVTFTQAVTVDPAWFDITCATTGMHDTGTEVPDGLNRWITPNTNFLAGEVCTVTVFAAKVHDAATGTLSPPQNYAWSFTVSSGPAAPETPDVYLLMGNPTGAVADTSQPDNYLMSKPQYALSYNRDLGRPNWVSWHLTNAWIPSNHPARVDTFRPDPAVPPDWYRVQSFDFSGSGFDRGHMSPNADREDSVPDNQGTFLMSNMVAQSPDNNQGPWADFENYLRTLVRSAPANEIYIVSGPAGTGGTGSNGAATTVAGGHVTVPASTWKVALVLPDNNSEDDISRVNCSTTTIAVIMPNVQGIKPNPWATYLTTVNAVEALTGYHFFTNLPHPIQNCIKAGTNGVNPKNNQTITFAPLAAATVGDYVPLQVSASSGLPVTLTVTAGSATIVNGTLHVTGAGTVTVQATQTGDVNYNAAPPVSQTINVARAMAIINVSGGTFVYDGNPHGLSGTATGVFGEDLSSLLTLGSTFVNAPGGLASWAFAGNTNYLPSTGSANVTITQAGAPAVAFIPGNLVVAVEGNGVAGAASGPYTDNQAGPLTLFQYAPNGTASAMYVNSLVLPQTGSGANLAVSGEYGSASEGTLQLSGQGQYLTIAGYGINAAAFNANPALYGSQDPSKPAALAQSGSLTGAGYTPVPRVLALIDPYGNVNSSTALYNVFNTNNPRSVYTADGMNIYVSGQGTGSDLTGGVFYTTLGSSSATAITGGTANSNTIAQDVRDVQIVGGQLYASIDTKEGSGSNRDYIGTLGPAGAPPTAVVGAPVRLPGFGNNGGTGKFTVTAATTNGVNSAGQEINLSPVNYFFATPTTLYVADSGFPKNDSATNDSNGVTLGNGGLQKWVLNSGTWSLQYTLGLQNGLPLVANSSAAGVTGLYGLTGKVVGGEVLLYATAYSIQDLEPTYLFGFTDVLAAATNPGTSFTQLAAAPSDSKFKGVAFAPAAPSGGVTITSSPSGMAFTSAGTGCAAGNYTTPVTLIWTPGSACTLTAVSPQPGTPGTQYQFHQWEDGSTSPARSVSAPASPTVYSAGFDTYYQLTTSAGVGGSVSAGGFILSGTVGAITATPDQGYGFTNWTGNVASANSRSTTITMNGPQSLTANFHVLVKPAITWAAPADIVYGTALGGAQLNATANVAGSFSYTVPAGTVLNAGSGQTLSATFTPDDPNNYTSATATVSINVNKAGSSTVVSCAPGSFVYTGSAITPCSAVVSGVGGLSQVLPVNYTNNINVGTTASASAAYGGDANHNSSSASLNFTISTLNATLSLSNLVQPYDGTPKTVTAAVSPLLCGAVATYNGSTSAPVFAGSYAVVASVTNTNCTGAVNGTLTIFVTGVVRHAPSLNAGSVHGAIQVLTPEGFAVNGSVNVAGDLLVPGTPTVNLNGHPTYGGTLDGAGSAAPSGQTITLGGNATVNHIVRRIDPIVMPAVSAPPAPQGTHDVVLTGSAGQVAVPPGTYGTLSATANNGFILGVSGTTTPAVYNLQQLALSGNARIDIVGPVVITVANSVNLNGAAGAQSHPEWLSLSVYSGGVTLKGTFYGYVVAPTGAVEIDGNSALHGGVIADSLTINGEGLVDLISQ